MNQVQYEDAKKTLEEVSTFLKDESLTKEERNNLEVMQSQLSGALLSIWIPFGWGRRFLMVLLFLTGIFGFVSGNIYFFISWLLLLLFSPRCIGLLFYALGRLNSNGK